MVHSSSLLRNLSIGALDLLRRMLDFNPSKRTTMSEALSCPVFEGLREDVADEPCVESLDDMTYWRGSTKSLVKPPLPTV